MLVGVGWFREYLGECEVLVRSRSSAGIEEELDRDTLENQVLIPMVLILEVWIEQYWDFPRLDRRN